MGFYYAKEKKQFDAEWKQLQNTYEEAGMSPTAIETMRAYDWEVFLSRRIYENHTQPLPDAFLSGEAKGERSTLFKKFASLSVSFDAEDFPDRYAWVGAIENVELAAKLGKLPVKDLELLTLYVIEGYAQAEIALLLGRNQSVISRKINSIKKFLKK